MNEAELEKRIYQEYLEYEKLCYDTKVKNSKEKDKIVAAIASGLFGILLTASDKFPYNECLAVWLKFLIISNGLTLILSLMSHFAANLAIDINLNNSLYKRNKTNYWYIITKFLNCGYLLTTFATIIALIVVLCYIF